MISQTLINGFLDNMPDLTGCDAHVIAEGLGLPLSPCDDFAIIGDPKTEMQFCAYHWPKYEAGRMQYLTR